MGPFCLLSPFPNRNQPCQLPLMLPYLPLHMRCPPFKCHMCHISVSSLILTPASNMLSHHQYLPATQNIVLVSLNRGKNDGITFRSRVPSLALIGPACQHHANAPLHLSLYYIPTWQTVPFANHSTALSGMVQSPPNFQCSFYTFLTSFLTTCQCPMIM